MSEEILTATATIEASADIIFAVLTDPATHAQIDGTGWIDEPIDTRPITAPGQIFRMAMYHTNHPNGHYEMANRVGVYDPPRTISWAPGHDTGGGTVGFGGWIWRYNLAFRGPCETEVALSYDWSGVSEPYRRQIDFPPFTPDHVDNSLAHVAELVMSRLATTGDTGDVYDDRAWASD